MLSVIGAADLAFKALVARFSTATGQIDFNGNVAVAANMNLIMANTGRLISAYVADELKSKSLKLLY